MRELNSARKIKINLSDYDFKKDIDNRLLIAEFSDFDREVLEEILYSSIHTDIEKLQKSLNASEKTLSTCLKKLSKTGLFEIKNEEIIVDKQMRKYFESEILKFNEDFKPDFEFLQGLLKKVPIQILPLWYSLSRSTSNIFDSIIEKYLITPQVFLRHIEDFQSKDPLIEEIIKEVYNPPFKVFGEHIKKKFNLSQIDLETILLTLEFAFIACLSYDCIDGYWKEVITPFYEWKEYLEFIANTEAASIKDPSKIIRTRPEDFAFVQDAETILNLIKKAPLPLQSKESFSLFPEKITELGEKLNLTNPAAYLSTIVEKLLIVKFAEIKNGKLVFADGDEWLSLSLENKALNLYQHPLNRLGKQFSETTFSESNIRKAEKCLLRALDVDWIYFDEFMKGIMCPLSDEQNVSLKKIGKAYRYILPAYSDEQFLLFKTVVFKWLFECSLVATGLHDNRPCFKVTKLGKKIFEV